MSPFPQSLTPFVTHTLGRFLPAASRLFLGIPTPPTLVSVSPGPSSTSTSIWMALLPHPCMASTLSLVFPPNPSSLPALLLSLLLFITCSRFSGGAQGIFAPELLGFFALFCSFLSILSLSGCLASALDLS